MELTPVELTPQRLKRILLVVVAAAIAIPLTSAVVRAASSQDPVDVVEEFFAAIVSRDVDAALALVEDGPPEGALLEPEAIADGWGLVSAEAVDHSSERVRPPLDGTDLATVRVRLAGPDGYADGELLARFLDDQWRLYQPFVELELHPGPLLFAQVNGVTVAAEDAGVPLQRQLLPGLYEFYSALPDGLVGQRLGPVMAFPAYDHEYDWPQPESYRVTPGRLTATEPLVTAVEADIAELIDDCVLLSLGQAPSGCPFASDGLIDTADGRRIEDIDTLVDWRVERYPEISLVDDRTNPWTVGFRVVAETEGIVTLSGRGENTEGETKEFTVECGIDVGRLAVLVTEFGNTRVSVTGGSPGNTCYRNP